MAYFLGLKNSTIYVVPNQQFARRILLAFVVMAPLHKMKHPTPCVEGPNCNLFDTYDDFGVVYFVFVVVSFIPTYDNSSLENLFILSHLSPH